ncbi:hypothetical protein VNI00_018422 [Paramarasmius palmivorus]|uniref:Uncharacterized protein n=1 Tax=Paramarasmius palmivorus TaxID=297713 RepID=A0AAW0AWV5_9AGAR
MAAYSRSATSTITLCDNCNHVFPVYPAHPQPENERFRSGAPPDTEISIHIAVVGEIEEDMKRYDSELDRLRKVVQEMELERNTLQRRLDEHRNLASAIRRLPVEIWDTVFRQSKHGYHSAPGDILPMNGKSSIDDRDIRFRADVKVSDRLCCLIRCSVYNPPRPANEQLRCLGQPPHVDVAFHRAVIEEIEEDVKRYDSELDRLRRAVQKLEDGKNALQQGLAEHRNLISANRRLPVELLDLISRHLVVSWPKYDNGSPLLALHSPRPWQQWQCTKAHRGSILSSITCFLILAKPCPFPTAPVGFHIHRHISTSQGHRPSFGDVLQDIGKSSIEGRNCRPGMEI